MIRINAGDSKGCCDAYSRRSFLHTNLTFALGASTFPSIIPASALGREGKIAPGSRIVVGGRRQRRQRKDGKALWIEHGVSRV